MQKQLNKKLAKLKKAIQEEVYITADDFTHTSHTDSTEHWPLEQDWIFDFRNILLQPEYLDLIADIFWEKLKDKYPFQVGGLESASIPLITAIVMKSVQKKKPVNGFFIRKSRHKRGLLRMIEGNLNDHKIVLVDDVINSGKSFIRQIEVLEKEGRKVHTIFTVLNYREKGAHTFVKQQRITLISLFPISEFGLDFQGRIPELPKQNFVLEWCKQSPNPNFSYILPKSTPVLDADKVYFGSDIGILWALNQNDGSEVWRYRIRNWRPRGKNLFSSPVVFNNMLYFGAYDGNVYALNTETGKKIWVYSSADWIGSSPTIAVESGLLFIGLEFGLFKKHGGVVALDLYSGEKRWKHDMPEFTHSSPAYLASKDIVVIGSNDGCAYLFEAKSGKLLWRLQTGGEIKASFAFDETRGNVLFGSHDGCLYIVDIESGALKSKFETKEAVYSTPLIYNDHAYVSSLDKRLYCIDLSTNTFKWSFDTYGRIFASPQVVDDKIYVGSNDGRLYELDPLTGKELSFYQTTERITNKVVYSKESKRFFLLTFANELHCLRKS